MRHRGTHGVKKSRRATRIMLSNLKHATPTESEAKMITEHVEAAKSPRTPGEFLSICEEQGGTYRSLSPTSYMVWGPLGQFKFAVEHKPNGLAWSPKYAISAAREAGFVIPGPTFRVSTYAVEENAVNAPLPGQMTVESLAADVGKLFRRIELTEDRVDAHAERLTELKRDIDRVQHGVRPLATSKYAVMRDEIMEWFRTMPIGLWFSYRSIIENMGIEDGPLAISHQNQLSNLCNAGLLERKGKGGMGGGSYLYRVPLEKVVQ